MNSNKVVMRGHGVWKCSCGRLIQQCRCIAGHHNFHIVQHGCKFCKEAIAKGFTPPEANAVEALRSDQV